MEPLDDRKQQILRAVILEYISGAEPIGSDTLTQKYDLGVRSATIRNELSEMSELGYLEQPHTSAGRVPSDLGYRYYVDHLVVFRTPKPESKQKLRQDSQSGSKTSETPALQGLLQETTRALSRMTHLLTAATTLRNQKMRVRNAVISALGPDRALVVLVLANGFVENRILEFAPGVSLQDVGKANEIIASNIEGMTLSTLTKARIDTRSMSQELATLVNSTFSSLRSMAKDLTRGQLITHGEEYLFAQPEFQRDPARLHEIVRTLEEEALILNALANPEGDAKRDIEAATDSTLAVPRLSELTITIGKEHRAESMKRFTVLRNSFVVGEEEAGAIAIIGPTRMDYDSSVPLLQYAAQAIGETLTRILK